MHYSNDRILVTHVGSLPRSPALLDMLGQAEAGEEVDRGAFQAEVLDGLREAVREQAAAGIDIAGDGELPRIGFSFYAKDRMTGFGGVAQRGTVTDFAKFPGYAELVVSRSAGQSTAGKSASVWQTPECVDEVRYDPELTQATEELDLFADALAAEPEASGGFAGTFVTAVTPGILATTLLRNPDNPAYPRDEDYVFALARELRREYEYIVSRGHILQLDAPDLALERQILFVDRPLAEFQARMEVHVAALNEALENIPKDRVRLHVCWGNWDGPHCDDVDLVSILPIIYQARVGGLSLACANPRHAHEVELFREMPLPEDMVMFPGVIDVTTNMLEHPEVVANRLCHWVDVIGDRERVIANTDCGFSTFAGYTMVAPDVVWAKMKTMADGAAIATERLWG
ncbi:MAG: methionine synthase [Gammaproteobacteria bacterium]|nr:methionine synthase [Gammaproteobacteria bacterium]